MKHISVKQVLTVLLLAVLIFLADRILKYLALNSLNTDVKLIDDFVKLSLQKNTGIAFSIGIPMFIQLLFFPVLLCFGLYFVSKYLDINKLFVLIVTGSVAGAALGNFYDRLFYGHVIDYISVSLFPVFNFADIVIVCGIFIIVAFYGRIKRV